MELFASVDAVPRELPVVEGMEVVEGIGAVEGMVVAVPPL